MTKPRIFDLELPIEPGADLHAYDDAVHFAGMRAVDRIGGDITNCWQFIVPTRNPAYVERAPTTLLTVIEVTARSA